jgi:hypothetical protein
LAILFWHGVSIDLTVESKSESIVPFIPTYSKKSTVIMIHYKTEDIIAFKMGKYNNE